MRNAPNSRARVGMHSSFTTWVSSRVSCSITSMVRSYSGSCFFSAARVDW
ncbi:MAG: hypothetical protein ACOZEN_06240 [Thermodesulfobacteriota bacterium]